MERLTAVGLRAGGRGAGNPFPPSPLPPWPYLTGVMPAGNRILTFLRTRLLVEVTNLLFMAFAFLSVYTIFVLSSAGCRPLPLSFTNPVPKSLNKCKSMTCNNTIRDKV
jgi:hypothetical protein